MSGIGDNLSCSNNEGLRKLIAQYRGEEDATEFQQFRAQNLAPIENTGKELLDHTPVFHGACAPMSAAWAALLRDRYNIPAVAVAGNLVMEGATVFLCDRNIPDSTDSPDIVPWDGHCWMEVGGYVGDASIFRTARTMHSRSKLRDFVERRFGLQRGLMLASRENLSRIDMVYAPKYVLTETQINALLNGLRLQVQRAYPGC